jgi:uncharacterized membrane protein
MNKKLVIAWIAIFVAWFLGSFIVHGVLLHSDYLQLGAMFRTDADSQKYFPLIILEHVMVAGAFTWIYARGVEAKPWVGQGVRFGIAVAFLTTIPTNTIYFAVQPMPAELAAKQALLDSVLVIFLGLIIGWVYRGKEPGA